MRPISDKTDRVNGELMMLMKWKRLWDSHWFRLVIVVTGVGGAASLARIAEIGSDPVQPNASPYFVLGVAALVASLVALFGDAIRGWIWRPVLTVDYVHGPDYCDTPVLRGDHGQGHVAANCFYFSLRIGNRGTKSADAVEVAVSDLHRKIHDRWVVVRRYSLNLTWAYRGTPRLTTLAPQTDRFCNIGHVIDPGVRVHFLNENKPDFDRSETVLSLDLEAQPNHGIHLLPPGTYRLNLLVAAANHRPIRRVLTIDLSGSWHSDLSAMLSQGIRIELNR